MRGLAQDVRFAVRGFRRNPGFTAVTVLLLGLVVGINSAMFSVVDAVVLRPLPLPSPEELVAIGQGRIDGRRPVREESVSWLDFLDWREQSRTIAALAAHHGDSFILGDPEGPEQVNGVAVSANFFDVLGVPPALGRGFARGEDQAGRNHVVILSDRLWRSRFAADATVVGRMVTLDGEPHTVVGVAPPALHFPPDELDDNLWTPIPHGPMDADLTQRRHHWLKVTGRLAPGVPVAQAQAELDTIQARLARQYPGVEEGRAIRVKGLKDELLGDVRARLLLLLAAVAFVLLIGCANVANLLLARTTVRRQEMAVRKALGASRGRLVRQLLVESGLLGILGGALGLVIAVWGLDLLVTLMPANLPHPRAISVDGRVLAFTTLVALVTGLAFGIVPALAGSNVHQAVRQSIRTASHGRAPARAVLLVGEIALTFVLLIGAGLSLRSFTRVGRVDPGFQAGGVLSASITLPGTRYRDRAARRTFYRQLLPRLRDLPGAECAAVASPLPYSDTTYNVSLGFTDRPTPPPGRRPDAPVTFVSPDYFRLMGIPLVRGRLFDATDEVDDAPAVAIISESLARQHWPGGDPLGKQLVAGGRPRTITGVVADIKTSLDHPGRAELYTPFAQAAESYLVALVRAPDPSALAEPLRAAVRDLDRGQPLGEIKTMKQRLHESLQQRRLSALLLGSFAGLALLLAMIGVYGVMSYAVTQRTRELGIRMALGAPGSEVVAMLLRHSLGLAALGLVAGLVPAFVLTRVMASQLYGISATDPTTCLGLAAALLGAATLASLLPALRAARLDPMLALRQE